MEESAKKLIVENVPQLKELAEKFATYQVVEVDLERIMYFIAQFDTYNQIELIIRLLKNIDFIDSKRMTFLLKTAFNKISKELLEKPVFCPLGGIQDSSAVVCYQLLKELFEKEIKALDQTSEVNSIGKYLLTHSPSVIIFVDDNITSGTQLKEFFKELIIGKKNAELVKTQLTKEEYDKLKQTPIRVCYAIQLHEESNDIVNAIKKEYELDIEIFSGKIDFNNYLDFQSNTIKTEDEAVFAKEFVRNISHTLYEDKEWTKETIYQRLLGYGNLGKLTVFYYNVPKSFIPIFWKFGYFKGKPWFPLFPETQEQKKIVKGNVGFEYFQLEAVKTWIQTIPQNRKPDILFGIKSNKEIVQSVLFDVPSESLIVDLMKKYFPFKSVEYESNNSVLNKEDYEKYMKAIDEFRLEYEDYLIKVREYIFRYSSKSKISFQIDNNGTIAATNLTLKMLINPSDLSIINIDQLLRPILKNQKPQKKYFNSFERSAILIYDSGYQDSGSHTDVKNTFITDFSYKLFHDIRIGHNDIIPKSIEVYRINLGIQNFEIPYEINFDEDAKTFHGKIKIQFKEVNSIDPKLELEIARLITNLIR